MKSRSFFVRWLFTFFGLAFVTEGRLFDPGARPDERSSSSELERLSNAVVTPNCILPPFVPPFALSDPTAFEWDSTDSSSYQLKSLNGKGDSFVLEKKSIFATSEDFDLVFTASSSNLGVCISDMDMKVEGINGVISGGSGTTNLKAIVIAFQENGRENTILLPVGGCDIHSRQLVRHEKLEDYCSIRPNSAKANECSEKCFESVETKHINQINKLDNKRERKVSKNLENKDIVLGKILISRANQMSTAFARCTCKHNDQDLGQCVLRIFLDTLVSENELQFEIEENFNQHIDELATWYEDNRKLICDASISAAETCSENC